MRKNKLLFTFLFSLQSIVFSQPVHTNDGDTLFGSSVIHSIYFNFYHPSYYDSLLSSYTLDRYYTCNMIIDGHNYDSVGVKFKGNSSYNVQGQKKSMKVDLDMNVNSQDVDDLNKFNLNNGFKDPTFIREKIMSDFLVQNNIPAPRVTYAKVYYNNQYWGLYTLVEECNKDFLKGWFDDKGGNLFKGDPNGDLRWFGSSPSSYYNKYELKTNETQNDWSDLVTFINKINNTPINNIRDTLNRYLDVTRFLQSWAATNIFVNLDSYIGSGHNYYIYHDSTDNKFKYIIWDINEAFGVFTMGMNISQLESLSPFYLGSPQTNRPLCNNLLQHSPTQQELTYWFCVLLQPNQFSNQHLDPIIDSLANRIRNDVYADPNKLYTNQNFENNLTQNVNVVGPGGGNFPGLKSFITNRRASLMNSLAPYGCYLSVQNSNDSSNAILLFPNPADQTINMFFENIQKQITIAIIDVLGKTVFAQNFENSNTININTSRLSSGFYTMVINGTTYKKLEIIH